jgi:antiviral helicase SKI2
MVEWLGNLKKVKCHLVSTNKRPVPLKHTIYWQDKLHTFLEDDTQWNLNVWTDVKKDMDKYFSKNRFSNVIFHNCIKHLVTNNLVPTTVFLLNREMVESQAKTLPDLVEDHMKSKEIKDTWGHYLRKYEKIYQHSEQWNLVYDLVNKSIGIHHSGMIPVLKEIVEILYSRGLIKVLLATETFAMGVNMPTKSVVFTNITKFDGKNKRIFRPEEYGQMAGRAGRRGLDTLGTVVILPFLDFINESEAKSIMLAPPQKIISRLSIDYSLILKLLKYKIDCSDNQNIVDYLLNKLELTLFNGQDSKEGNHLFLEKDKAEIKLDNINKILDKNTKDKRELYEKLIDINNKLKPDGFMVLNKKQEKALLKEKQEITLEIPQSIFNQLDMWVKSENEVNKINKEIEFNKIKLSYHIEKILTFLQKKELIIDMDSNFVLSQKGRIIAEINEYNPLIMGRIIEEGLLDELEFHEIMAILSLFIADKDKEEIFLDEVSLCYQEKNIIKKIYKIVDDTYDEELKLVHDLPFPFRSEYNLAFNLYDTIKEWITNKTVSITSFEGNFIKNILRLTNLTKNIETIAKLLNNVKLFNKLEGHQEKLIKGIVITDSLYI